MTAVSDETGRDWLPLKYEDGPDFCTVTLATGAAFALTVYPERMKLMEAALSASPVAQEPVAQMTFFRAMGLAERGFENWKAKEHNAKWFKRIDGTPIPNDLLVNIAEAFCNDET